MGGPSKLLVRLAVMAWAVAMVPVAGCDGGNAVKERAPTIDSGAGPAGDAGPTGSTDGGPDGGSDDCVRNPQTHEEIINGCTDAVKITKNPVLPLLYPDGGLPPLP
jgi:hypothetical protein